MVAFLHLQKLIILHPQNVCQFNVVRWLCMVAFGLCVYGPAGTVFYGWLLKSNSNSRRKGGKEAAMIRGGSIAMDTAKRVSYSNMLLVEYFC